GEHTAAASQHAVPQHLRRIALPRVLLAVEAHETAEQQHGKTDVWIDAEQELMKVMFHAVLLMQVGRTALPSCGCSVQLAGRCLWKWIDSSAGAMWVLGDSAPTKRTGSSV